MQRYGMWFLALMVVACSDDSGSNNNGGSGTDLVETPDSGNPDEDTSQPQPGDTTGDDTAADTTTTQDSGNPGGPDVTDPTDDIVTAPEDTNDDDTTPQWTVETVPLRGVCPMEEYVGGFLVEVYDDYSIVDGKVFDSVNPANILKEVKVAGDCRMLQLIYPVCLPPCGPGFTCDYDGSCIVYPEQKDIGTVTVEGLSQTVVMTPKPPSNSYFDTKLPHPAFVDGSLIHVTSTEGYAGIMDMYGIGSNPIQMMEPNWTIERDKPLVVQWDPAPDGARTKVELRLNIDQHGNSPVNLFCELPDTGQVEIAAELINQLYEFGVSGYPNARLSRRTVDSMEIVSGCIEFIVGAPKSAGITIVGHYPCSSPNDCPDGLTCNFAIETCE